MCISPLHSVITNTSATKLDLKFNGTKSQYLKFPADNSISQGSIYFGRVEIPLVSEGKHLGRILSPGTPDISTKGAVRDLVMRFNVLMTRFRFCSPEVRYRVFKTYCVIAYSSQLWNFDDKYVHQYFAARRKCIRRVWDLPPTTHCHLLPGICKDDGIIHQLLLRSVNFIRNCVHSKNYLVQLASKRSMSGSCSSISSTIAFIRHNYNVPIEFLKIRMGPLPRQPEREIETAVFIREISITNHYTRDQELKEIIDRVIGHVVICTCI